MLLFVYGSLKRGFSNVEKMETSTFRETAITSPHYRLLSYGEYPALVHAPEDQGGAIHGEIWEVPDDVLVRLDQFEGVAESLYTRGPIQLEGSHRDVETYFYAQPTEGFPDCGTEWIEGHPYWDEKWRFADHDE